MDDLTATRSESARGVRFDKVDGDIWTIPAERMKRAEGKVDDFRVPLPQAAIELLQEIKRVQSGEYRFPSYWTGYISSTALAEVLNEMGEPGRPHGFRTSFRTWVQDTDAASFDVAETAIAHRVGSKGERFYARSDMLGQRRVLMDSCPPGSTRRWGRFCIRGFGGALIRWGCEKAVAVESYTGVRGVFSRKDITKGNSRQTGLLSK